MAFLINCNNKGCGKLQPPALDTTSNEVFCTECGKSINNVTSFAKNQMKSIGQVVRATKEAFSIKCLSCKKEASPVLIKNDICCKYCSNKLVVSKHFEPILREHLKNKSDDNI